MKRLRRVLVGAGTGIALVVGVAATVGWTGARTDTVGQVRFDRPLRIPPLAPSSVDAQGRRVFTLTAQAGTSDFGTGSPVRTIGYDGSYLGPTVRAHRGEHLLVHVRNRLAEETTLHWHGMHLPAAADGGPHQPIHPGATWSPSWRVDQPAATLWYHAHPDGTTADQVARGLAGLVILDDDREDALPLPHKYGVDDLPVVVQDKDVHGTRVGDGLGSTMVVNGTPGAYADVVTTRVRLRLLNASTMRVYDFRLDDGSRFDQIATDGGLLPAPVPTGDVLLAPGERAEVVVSMRPGERRVLRGYGSGLGVDVVSRRFTGGDDRFDVLQLRAAARLATSPALPVVLAGPAATDPAVPTEAGVTMRRTFVLSGRQINNASMDMGRTDFRSVVGTTEEWTVVNDSGTPHSFHVHDTQFRVVRVNSAAPPPALSGPKDTVYLPPRTRMTLVLRFTDYTDAAVPYMIHCHMLRHEDEGMMSQFLVVAPGDARPAPAAAGDQGATPMATTHHH